MGRPTGSLTVDTDLVNPLWFEPASHPSIGAMEDPWDGAVDWLPSALPLLSAQPILPMTDPWQKKVSHAKEARIPSG